jgi:hypothetical protein
MNPDASGLIEITQRPTEFNYAKVMSGLSRPRFPAQSGREPPRGRTSSEIHWAVTHRN